MSANQCGDKIEVKQADQAPIQSSDNYEYAGEYIQFFSLVISDPF